MSESYRPTPQQPPWSGSKTSNGYQAPYEPPHAHDEGASTGEAGRVLLVGVLGGLLSAAGYMIYRRLPDEQKEKLHSQVRTMVQQRINELRQNFNI